MYFYRGRQLDTHANRPDARNLCKNLVQRQVEPSANQFKTKTDDTPLILNRNYVFFLHPGREAETA